MFSWIIEHEARILSREGWLFRIENRFSDPLELGQSIAHDGACMTLTEITPDHYEFFVMQESLSVTALSDRKVWDSLNVERALSLGDRLDGHMVSGHIDTVGVVTLLERKPDGSLLLGCSYPNEYTPLLIRKGSITLNGVSLTIVESEAGRCHVSLIPLTQEWTNLGKLALGARLNIEFDMIGKYIVQFQQNLLQSRES